MTDEEVKSIIDKVREGYMSARHAAVLLDWTVDDVCIAAFGSVVLWQ